MRPKVLENVLKIGVKIGLWSVLLLPLYISGQMLFPFITGKNFLFRAIVELTFAFWVGLAILSPSYRPRLTPIFKAVTVFIMVVFLADLFGPNPFRSFFSNYERMEGFMMLFHLYLYFVMLVSAFKTRKDWLIFMHVSLLGSLVVSFMGLLQKFGLRVSLQGGYRIDSTIGNPAYLAAYTSLHMWMLLLLLRMFWKNWALRMFYAAAFIFEAVIVYFTATRGAILADIVGIILLLALGVIYWRKIFLEHLAYRKLGIAFLGLALLIPITLWLFRNSPMVSSNQILRRLTSISLSDGTTLARFSIWNMSLRGVMERPILGWGQENYYLVFQKYYNPKLFAQEPWFDRSHNVIFDWLIHAGFLGLFSYLSILGIAIWGVFGLVRKNIDPLVGILLTVAFVSYFFQNLFVFDNLNTYLLFFGFLAYTQFLTHPDNTPPEKEVKKRLPYALAGFVAVFFLVGWAGYSLHWKAVKESKILIRALFAQQAKKPLAEIEQLFSQALSYNTFGDMEVREQLGNVARDVVVNENYSVQDRAKFSRFAIGELKKEVSNPAKDIKHIIFLASIMSRSGQFDSSYLIESEQMLKEAISLSPSKQMLYFELAQLYLSENRIQESLDLIRTAVDLEPSYQQAVANLIIIAALANRPDVIQEMKQKLDVEALPEDGLSRVGVVFQQLQDLPSAKIVFSRLIKVNPGNAKYRATAAAIFAHFQEYDRAIEEAEEAAKLDPSFAPEAKIFIEMAKKAR